MVAEDGEDWKEVAAAGAATPQAPAAAAPTTSAPTGGSTPGTAVNMPSLSPTMTEVRNIFYET